MKKEIEPKYSICLHNLFKERFTLTKRGASWDVIPNQASRQRRIQFVIARVAADAPLASRSELAGKIAATAAGPPRTRALLSLAASGVRVGQDVAGQQFFSFSTDDVIDAVAGSNTAAFADWMALSPDLDQVQAAITGIGALNERMKDLATMWLEDESAAIRTRFLTERTRVDGDASDWIKRLLALRVRP